MWTRFMDMHSGGGLKTKWSYIYIEAPEREAAIIFKNRFGQSAYLIGCDCCGGNFSISEETTLEQATGYDRGCHHDGNVYLEKKDHSKWSIYKEYLPLAKYLEKNKKRVLVIYRNDIKPAERVGSTGKGRYEWVED